MLIIDSVSLFSLICESEKTIKEVAKEAGISPVTLTNYVNNVVKKPDTVVCGKLAKALGVKPKAFLNFVRETTAIPNYEFAFMLSQRERDVLEYRNGQKTGQPMTLEEVGTIYGVTRERIRQLENRATQRLRWYSINKNDERVQAMFKERLVGDMKS